MWCRNCQQDVPAIRGEDFAQTLCSRCHQAQKSRRAMGRSRGKFLSEIERQDINPNKDSDSDKDNSDPSVEHATDVKSDSIQAQAHKATKAETVVDNGHLLGELNSEISRIDRIISVWGEEKQLRFDTSHSISAELDPTRIAESEPEIATENPAQTEEQTRSVPQTKLSPSVLVACLIFGGLLAIVLGAWHGLAHSGPNSTQDTRIAMSFIGAGVVGIILGQYIEMNRLRTLVRKSINRV